MAQLVHVLLTLIKSEIIAPPMITIFEWSLTIM